MAWWRSAVVVVLLLGSCCLLSAFGSSNIRKAFDDDVMEAAKDDAMQAATKRNFIYIIADDLTADLSLFGGKINQIPTPNLDRLAKQSVSFERAYAQQAVCGPSRNSFLSGYYPDEMQVYTFMRSFRDAFPDTIPLPQAMKQNGYLTCGFGKVYHDDGVMSPLDHDEPKSWSQECGAYFSPPPDTCELGKHGWCVAKTPDFNLTDIQTTTAALNWIKKREHDRPFFFMVGLRKPHLDWAVRQSDLDAQVPVDKIVLPSQEYRVIPRGFPPVSWWNCSSESPWMRSLFDVPLYPDTPLADDLEKEIRRGYYAAVTLMDSQVGRLMDELKQLGLEKNTAIIFHSDHGFHLSDGGMFCKQTTTEIGSRVPLLVSVPWLMGDAEEKGEKKKKGSGRLEDVATEEEDEEEEGEVGEDAAAAAAAAAVPDIQEPPPIDGGMEDVKMGHGAGTKSKVVVELVDIYPTLLELAGLEANPILRGKSLVYLLQGGGDENKAIHAKHGLAFSQYPRCLSLPARPGIADKGYLWNRQCMMLMNDDIDVMGYAIRAPHYRYIEWYEWDAKTWTPIWNQHGLIANELYVMDGDLLQEPTQNMVDDPKLQDVKKKLSDLLARHFGEMIQPKPGVDRTPPMTRPLYQ